MWSLRLCSLVVVVAQTASATEFGTHIVKERLAEVPRGWRFHNEPPSSYPLKLQIALPQPNFEVLERELYEVSDPNHPRYGQHLSEDEVNRLVAPHQDSLSSIDEWLASHGFDVSSLERSPARDWVTIVLPVSKAEEMLGTKYAVWEHSDSLEKVVRTTEYSLPESIHKHVHLITPTTMFGSPRPQKTTYHYEDQVRGKAVAIAPASCNSTITISCLQALYNTGNYTATVESNRLGIAGYLEEFANFDDLQIFYQKYYPAAAGSNFTVESVNGGVNPQDPDQAGGEAQLDVQYAGGISYPIQNVYYTTAGRPPFNPSIGTPDNSSEPYLEFLQYLLIQKNPPQTISTSYGDEEQTVPIEYAKRVCGLFAQLGARGVTFLFSSGDGGVGDGDGSTNSTDCVSNDGGNKRTFLPVFPASCPYVTAVGGTHYIPEVAVGFSGGGFSNYFARPIYQAIDVPLYLKKLGGAYSGLYNPTGRAYPDIAAQGSHFRVIVGGTDYSIGGTSASAPTVAGVVALLNDARLAKGLPPLGFLNPWLYTLGRFGLNDITKGNNPGCGTPGFNATVGWDPITGLGTPDFGKLRKIAAPF